MSQLKREARVAFLAALVAAALAFIAAGLFDPFGRDFDTATTVSRATSSVNLCIQRDTYTALLSGNDELSDVSRDALENGLARMEVAISTFEITCPADLP